MSEVWAAAIGAVISTGLGVAAQAAIGGPGFGGAPPVQFNAINYKDLNSKLADLTKIGYDTSDADLTRRLPGLVLGNKQLIEDTTKQLNGPLDPSLQNIFARNAIESSLAATGGGNANAAVGPVGSASGNAAAVTIGNAVQNKQDVDRGNLSQLLTLPLNQERVQGGLSGSQLTQLKIGDALNENQYNIGKYQYDTQKAAADNGGGF